MQTVPERRHHVPQYILGLVALLAILAVGAGCGGDDTPEEAATPRAMLPAGTDSAAAGMMATPQAGAEAGADAVVETGRSLEQAAATAGEDVLKPVADTARDAVAETQTRVREVATPSQRLATDPTGQTFSLQLGSYGNAANAQAQLDRVAGLGYTPAIEVATLAGQTYHRVVLTGLADRAAAERTGEDIRSRLGITYLIRQK